MSAQRDDQQRVTVPSLSRMKAEGRSIAMTTVYDATFARLVDGCGIDVLLVGDSLGMVIKGEPNTLSVTLEDVLYHTRAVVRGSTRAHVVADMPFMSYQADEREALRNAGRLLQEGGAHAVKIEGGKRYGGLVRSLTEIGIPVMGHIGLTPQSIHAMGGYKVQGRNRDAARKLIEDAQGLQDAGAYAVVLEAIPQEVARQITELVEIPTIGIGAGPHCDGQVLVIYDLLGMDPSFTPRFVKRYETLAERITGAVSAYVSDVRAGAFPGPEHSWSQRGKRAAAQTTGARAASQATAVAGRVPLGVVGNLSPALHTDHEG